MKKQTIFLSILILISLALSCNKKSIPTNDSSLEEEIFLVKEAPINFPDIPPCEDELNLELKDKCFTDELMKLIYKRMEYPTVAKKNKIEGRVVVRLDLDKENKSFCIKLIKDLGAGTGKEGVRITNLALQELLVDYKPCKDKWEPAKARGNPVGPFVFIPIRFELE